MRYDREVNYFDDEFREHTTWSRAFSALFDHTFDLHSLAYLKHLDLAISFVNINLSKESLPTLLETVYIWIVYKPLLKSDETSSIDLSNNLRLRNVSVHSKTKWKRIQLPKSSVLKKLGIHIANDDFCSVECPMDLKLELLVLCGKMRWNNVNIDTRTLKINLSEELENVCIQTAKYVIIACGHYKSYLDKSIQMLNSVTGIEELSFAKPRFHDSYSFHHFNIPSLKTISFSTCNMDVLENLKQRKSFPKLKSIILALRYHCSTHTILFENMLEMFKDTDIIVLKIDFTPLRMPWYKKSGCC